MSFFLPFCKEKRNEYLLTAGYRLSLGKGGCWCLEFSLGAGYAYLDYDRFFNIPGGAYVDTRHKNFFATKTRRGWKYTSAFFNI